MEILFDYRGRDVVGFVEVFSKLPSFYMLLRRMVAEVRERRPKLALLVDFPGFHLPLAQRLTQLCVPVIWFIPPMLYGRKGDRAEKVKESTTAVIPIFPQEEARYRAAGARSFFFGHPLAREIAPPASKEEGLVALLPGSRPQEVERLLPIMLETAKRLSGERPGLRFVVAFAHQGHADRYAEQMARLRTLPLSVEVGRTRQVLAQAYAGLVCSGTATLEAALSSVPHVICYQVNRLTEWIARRHAPDARVGLPNIVLERDLVPECLQAEAAPQVLAQRLRPLLDPASYERRAQLEGFAQIRAQITGGDVYQKVAQLLVEHAQGTLSSP